MTRILVVSVESPWPANHGGRLRVARVAEALQEHFEVLVTFPDHGTALADPPVTCRPLPWSARSAAWTRARVRPHLGGYFLLPAMASLSALCRELRPDAIYWSHSYLAAWSPRKRRRSPRVGEPANIVEFANIESRRLRTLVPLARGVHRVARAVEAAKATMWEPRVARRASFCVALSEQDQDLLRRWRASSVLVPNGVETVPYVPSPADGYALAIASYDYEPNVVAVRRLVRDIWPLVRRDLPAARLVVAGRASEALRAELAAVPGVTVIGTVADVCEVYAEAAVTLAPATTGGGSQLKLTESLSRGRCVVMTPFAARGLPGPLRDCEAYRVAAPPHQFAGAIVEALGQAATRQARERSGWQRCQALGWSQTLRPLVDAIERVTTARDR
jgi:polysaccharide biosynthesis protein PslH